MPATQLAEAFRVASLSRGRSPLRGSSNVGARSRQRQLRALVVFRGGIIVFALDVRGCRVFPSVVELHICGFRHSGHVGCCHDR